ncbi:peptide chain release factor N(5)-glutamine methyltransferase [Bifidobacterium moraviense]
MTVAAQTVPVADLIRAAAARLREAGVDTPDHDAKLLLAHAAGREPRDVDKAMLMGETWTVPDGFDAMVARRASREPLQYVTGHAPFRYLDLQVGPGVFIPRPETELVVQEGLDWLTAQHGLYSPRVVDLCAGSGAIGLAVASEVPGAQVWAVELSERTAAWTKRNLEAVARINPQVGYNYQLEIGDATSRGTLAALDGTVDLVISNPPYVPESQIPEQPEVRDHDPALALYGGSADGTLIPERIIERAFALLRPGGLFVMEHDIMQGDRLAAYAHVAGFATAVTHNDYTGRPRYLTAEKGA